MTLRVLLAGQEAAGAQTLKTVAESEHELIAVLTQDPAQRGGPASLSAHAERAGVRVLPATLVRDPEFATQMREWSIDVLLNVHSLHIISDDVLGAPAIGSFNLHPGPLPEYAGLNTGGWAIFQGESEYGVTVHWMAPKIDAGPIAFQERFPVDDAATALTLSTECTRRGVQLLAQLLSRAAADPSSIPTEAQDLTRRRYYPKGRVPQGGRIDWTRPAAEVERFARAFDYGPFASPWGHPFFEVGGEKVEVLGLRSTGNPTHEPPGTPRLTPDGLVFASADRWLAASRLLRHGQVIEAESFVRRVTEDGSFRGPA